MIVRMQVALPALGFLCDQEDLGVCAELLEKAPSVIIKEEV